MPFAGISTNHCWHWWAGIEACLSGLHAYEVLYRLRAGENVPAHWLCHLCTAPTQHTEQNVLVLLIQGGGRGELADGHISHSSRRVLGYS